MNTTTDKIGEYQERLDSLYNDMIQWLDGSDVEFTRTPVELDEVEVGHYTVDALTIRASSGDPIATIQPVGVNIIGAEGQIRVVGLYDSPHITYYVDKGPRINIRKSANGAGGTPEYLLPGITQPGWYIITDAKTGETRQLDEGLLKEILAGVSDYGV